MTAAVLQWLEASARAVLIQQSAYGFVIAVAVHLLGLTLSVGTADRCFSRPGRNASIARYGHYGQ
jgi:hypothetical protein